MQIPQNYVWAKKEDGTSPYSSYTELYTLWCKFCECHLVEYQETSAKTRWLVSLSYPYLLPRPLPTSPPTCTVPSVHDYWADLMKTWYIKSSYYHEDYALIRWKCHCMCLLPLLIAFSHKHISISFALVSLCSSVFTVYHIHTFVVFFALCIHHTVAFFSLLTLVLNNASA